MLFVVAVGDKGRVGKIYAQNKLTRRGNIFDRNGTLVATDLKTKSLYVSSILVKDPEKITESLVKIFPELSRQDILRKIRANKSNQHWILIRRNLTPAQVEEVQNLKLAGLLFEDDRVRIYPQRAAASHLVGYVDLDRNGIAGMEMEYDKQLLAGEDIELAMDIRAQDILNDELEKGLEEFRAQAAAGLIMDVTNGEVLAVSSLPSFDPNIQAEASSNQRFNRITSGVYELGSIFKIFTNTLAFDKNLIKITDSYDVSEPFKYGRFTIKDDHPVKGRLTIPEIFSHSSNIGTIEIAKNFSASDQKDFLEKMHMLKKLDGDFPGLAKPIYPRIWREINLYTISYGHGIAVTPLHIANAVSAIVNGGTFYQPSFAKIAKEKKGEKVIKAETSEIIKSMMRKVVLEGTGRNANVEGYEVAGKTGTAEMAEMGGYSEKKTITSFVAVFPISDPKYLVLVLFDRPNYIFNTGGMVSAPVAGRVVKEIAPILGVMPR